MKLILVFLVLGIATAASHAINDHHVIRSVVPKSGGHHSGSTISKCRSWRLAVEIYNLRDWKVVPAECISYIGAYMMGKQHGEDCTAAADAAFAYAQTLNLTGGDGKDAWLFDVEQTALSLLDYYARPDVQFGGILYNHTRFEEWLQAGGRVTANPAVLDLYHKLRLMGFRMLFISEVSSSLSPVTITNLLRAGYNSWKLVVKLESEHGMTAQEYKTKKRTMLVEDGYRIHGNMGDQWSDLIGDNNGGRTFKLPNPMFFTP